ncbi:MAG: 30S ribosomal protein S8 [Gammaproteobacteria bacterium]|jgi:small subunit ribosomal protein S8
MSMQDPIADLLTRIKNGYMAKKSVVSIPASKLKQDILKVLHQEGYIEGYTVEKLENNKSTIMINLKYYKDKSVISKIKRVSMPGLRVYKGKKELPKVLGGLGISIISTTRGIVSDKEAKKLGQGGEILCYVE